MPTFEVGLYATPQTDLLDIFTQSLCIRYDNVTLSFNFIGVGLGTCSALIVGTISYFPRWLIEPFLHLVQSSFRVFASAECFPEMIHFFAEKLRIATHYFGPVGKGVNKYYILLRGGGGCPTVNTGLYE